MKVRKFISGLLVIQLLVFNTAPAVLADETAPSSEPTATDQSPEQTSPTTDQATEPSSAASPETTATQTQTQTTPTEPAADSPGPSSSPGPSGPTGPTESTGPSEPTGVIPRWAFDESTSKWVATRQDTFAWDRATGYWESPYYRHNLRTGWYYVIPAPVSATSNPAVGGSAQPPTPIPTGIANPYQPGTAAYQLAALLGLSDPVNRNTGAGSTNTGTLNNNTNVLIDILSRATVNNNTDSSATTGDAAVSRNTGAGSATTGVAKVLANFFNLINSAWSWSTGGLSYFVGNMLGDHTGDITLAPRTASAGGGSIGCYFCSGGAVNGNYNTGADSTNTATTNQNQDLTINYQPTGTINNDANLLAHSGSATVAENTVGGNATSGDAAVVLNILNMINSAIGAGQSFFGMLNIFGNFNGDVLFPAGFVTGTAGGNGCLICAGGSQATNQNTGPGSANDAAITRNTTANITDSSQSTFNNNIAAAAASGNALVDANTQAGSATTGQATTDTATYNLFNAGVMGENAVLVLVNVLGHWVGGILNLPGSGGSSSALLTGNATVENIGTGPNSTNLASYTGNTNLNINYAPTSTINNNINAGAISGDATVSRNTKAGNATTGDASVATNIVNIMGSRLNLSRWFGVLVINVFGDWFGSVGRDTEAGNAQGGGSLGLRPAAASAPAVNSASGSSHLASHAAGSGGSGGGAAANIGSNAVVSKLAGSVIGEKPVKLASAQKKASRTGGLLIVTAVFLSLAGGLAGLERKFRGQ